jgi:hypothetical protein
MKKINLSYLLILLVFTSCNLVLAQNTNQGQGNQQWKINGNIADENYYLGTKNEVPIKFRTNDIERFRISPSGDFGIGTSTPESKLDVNGSVILRESLRLVNLNDSDFSGKELLLIDGNGNITRGKDLLLTEFLVHELYTPWDCQAAIINNPRWSNGPNKIFTECPQVNVGISTTTPRVSLDVLGTTYSQKLFLGNIIPVNSNILFHAKANFNETQDRNLFILENNARKIFQINNNGLVQAREIKVDLASWPDYVFQPSYNLMPLKDLKTYLDTNKHLPNVPTAKTIETEGVNLGEMSKISMEKIEELTLYLLQQQVMIEIQSKLLEEQVQKIKALEEKFKSKN